MMYGSTLKNTGSSISELKTLFNNVIGSDSSVSSDYNLIHCMWYLSSFWGFYKGGSFSFGQTIGVRVPHRVFCTKGTQITGVSASSNMIVFDEFGNFEYCTSNWTCPRDGVYYFVKGSV